LTENGVVRLRFLTLLEGRGLVLREGSAFVKQRSHLAIELADRPSSAQSLGMIEGESFRRAGTTDEQDVMRPGQRERAGELGERERR
jgi:hypothetical protein